MNYTQYYENKITQALDKKETELWKNFYDNILPERIEQFKKSYKGNPKKLNKAIEKLENDAADEFSENVDNELSTLYDKLKARNYSDVLRRLDQLSGSTSDKVDKPISDSQPLVSEIITDQSAEIEKLKAELQNKQENLDICAGLADRYMYRQRIVECALKLKDEKLLKCAYTYMKKLTEGEE